MIHIDKWAKSLLADPVTKLSASQDQFSQNNGVLDARVFLKNTHGYDDWSKGQISYESWEVNSAGYQGSLAKYKAEINYDRPVYDRFKISGDILDVGGGVGTLREFLEFNCRYICIDPFVNCVYEIPKAKKEAYSCLANDFNFIAGMAEFLPFLAGSFDWVHMRSMLDHVQVPDLALIEASRVLKNEGNLLVGLYVEGGKTGKSSLLELAKEYLKHALTFVGIDKYKDMHTWHPTFVNLLKLIEDAGFSVNDVFWQPYWSDKVVYVHAKKQVATSKVLPS